MVFKWDPKKAAANVTNHGIDFREASTVLNDVLSTTFPDIDHSDAESRFMTIGRSALGRILVVVHSEYGDVIRVISARRATPRERSMKKASRKLDIRAEYDFRSMKGGVRGKYVTRYRAGSRVAPKRQKTSRG